MREIFLFSFNAVMPILLLAGMGWILRMVHFADDGFFKKLNRLVFRVFLPILLYVNIYSIESIDAINWGVILFCAAVILVIFLAGYFLSGFAAKTRAQKGVLIQCFFRSNYAIIGLPLAQSLAGDEALAFASILSAVSIPLFNLLAVTVLCHYSEGENENSLKKTLVTTARNPLILSVLAGVITVALRNTLPVEFTLRDNLPFLYSALVSASKIASPLALVVLGARFDVGKVSSLFRQISLGVFARLVFAPVLALCLGFFLSKYTGLISLTQVEYPALIALFATPVAVSSAVMVGEIGGDEQLAGQLVVWTSLISIFTMFGIIFVVKALNLI